MNPLTFDWSVSAGSVLITLTNLGGLLVVAWRISIRFTLMERKVNLMFAWFLRQVAGKPDAMTKEELSEFFGVDH